MKHYAKLLYISPHIEEEMLLCLGEVKLLCFADSVPYPVQVGKIYPVVLTLWYLEGCKVYPLDEMALSITRAGNDFSHKIHGFLADDKLITKGVVFQDDYFAEQCIWLDGHFVGTVADRISLEFC